MSYVCDNCGHRENDPPEAKDLHLRLDDSAEGGSWTDRECSQCGALTYERLTDREYLQKYAGLADNVSTILHDRESLDMDQDQIDAIIRQNLDAVYEVIGRALDDAEDLIARGHWTAATKTAA